MFIGFSISRMLLFKSMFLSCVLYSANPSRALSQIQPPSPSFDEQHRQCLLRIREDNLNAATNAYEQALTWQSQGGGWRADHCIAMSLSALGHADEAAFRLENLADSLPITTQNRRIHYYLEASEFWLLSQHPKRARKTADKALDLLKDKPNKIKAPLYIARARAHIILKEYQKSENDLNKALDIEPNNAVWLRYRADIRRRTKQFKKAKQDIEHALRIAPQNIDNLVIRGQIYEAIRLNELGLIPIDITP